MPIDAINPDEYIVDEPQRSMLPKARKQAAGGALTQNVQPQNPIAAYRQKEAELFQQGSDLYNSEPDMTQYQAYARQRASDGQGAMLNALAAQFAGEGFQPIQAQFLKKAAAAQEPMKVGAGMLTADGRYLKDPTAERDRKAEFLLRQAQMYGNMALNAESKQEQHAALERQRLAENALKEFIAQTGRMNAVTAAGGGAFGAGQATQIGSGPNNEPVFRQRNGQLFTYDASGQPIAYAGQVLPKAGTSQPGEDERKAAGYMARIDQGLRLINGITQQTPSAATPSVTAAALDRLPVVGNMASNVITPEARQRVEAAQLDMLDAALTLATGAAYTKEQLQGLSKAYFTQIGDDPQTIKDKRTRLENIIQTARIRAGRALPQVGGAAAPGGPAADLNDPLGVRR